MHEAVARPRFWLKMRFSPHGWATFGRRGRKNVHVVKRRKRTEAFRVERNHPHCQRWEHVGRFGGALLLCGMVIGGDEAHWHSCAGKKEEAAQRRSR